jgi:hypothetical protein
VASHISPSVFGFIGLLILAAGLIVSISSSIAAGVPLYVIACLMIALWWYQRRRLSRS